MAESLDTYSDIEDDLDELSDFFNRAAQHASTLASQLQPPQLLELYSYYKQAVDGKCNIPRPRFYEMQAKAKWDAWNSLGDMPQSVAKQRYVTMISGLDPDFAKSKTDQKECWVVHSCLADSEDIVNESDKTVFDYVKENDAEKLVNHIQSHLEVLRVVDEDGLGLIHWAADRGNVEILKYLLQLQTDVNMTDRDGQTALHYAVSCDHVDCVKLLVEGGIDINKTDEDGMSAKDLTTNNKILEYLTCL